MDVIVNSKGEKWLAEIIVEFWQRGLVSDSGVKFVCESAHIEYGDRKVVMRAVKQLGNLQGKKLLIGLSVEDGNLIAKFPPSEKYTIIIAGQEHVLSVIK